MVLDHQYRIAGVNEALEHVEQALDVGEVQAGGRLVENIERLAGRSPTQLGGELDPLRLTAGERRRGLAEANVAHPHVAQGFEALADARHVGEKV